MSAATPIRPGADRQAPKVRELQPAVKETVKELQTRVRRLRNLIQSVELAECDGDLDDTDAAFDGLLELADAIRLAMDPQTVIECAQEIVQDQAREEARKQENGAE